MFLSAIGHFSSRSHNMALFHLSLTMSSAAALGIWITVDIEIDTALSPHTAVLHTATVACWACVEVHHIVVGLV